MPKQYGDQRKPVKRLKTIEAVIAAVRDPNVSERTSRKLAVYARKALERGGACPPVYIDDRGDVRYDRDGKSVFEEKEKGGPTPGTQPHDTQQRVNRTQENRLRNRSVRFITVKGKKVPLKG